MANGVCKQLLERRERLRVSSGAQHVRRWRLAPDGRFGLEACLTCCDDVGVPGRLLEGSPRSTLRRRARLIWAHALSATKSGAVLLDDRIDWAITLDGAGKGVWAEKLFFEWLPVLKGLVRENRAKYGSSVCRRCDAVTETTEHMLLCDEADEGRARVKEVIDLDLAVRPVSRRYGEERRRRAAFRC